MTSINRKLPIGVQSFEKLIQQQYVYVDKTALIYKMVHTGTQLFLSRPRRFGKSLLLSTLDAYWNGKKELFEGTAIYELEKDNSEAWKQYPVFYFDFNGKNYSQDNAIEAVLNEYLSQWENQYGVQQNHDLSLEERFRKLIIIANEKTNRRCVVLVDEYDKPLLETIDNPELEEHNKAVFKSFFAVLKSFDKYMQFVLITGVTIFNKVSIFSDLNQLNDISLNRDYSAICGITEEEIKKCFKEEIGNLAAEQKMQESDVLLKLKNNYDGYRFNSKAEGVYNPFSILKCFDSREFGQYWFESGTPTFLVKKLKMLEFDVRQFSDMSLYATEKRLLDYRGDNQDPLPLLYQTGYLSIKDYSNEDNYYTLGFPNDEVKYGFLESLIPEYTPAVNTESGKDILSIKHYVENAELDKLRDSFLALFASITYTSKEIVYEHYFQTVIYLVFTLLGQYVHCEVHSSSGRADCIVETKKYVYIFEFKKDKSATEALKQIDDTGYALSYAADKRNLIKIGINFNSETRLIDGWDQEI